MTGGLPTSTRAAVVRAHGEPLTIEQVPLPERLAPGSLLVEVLACSVCGTDVHGWLGHLTIPAALPSVPGHEMVGRILAFGEGAELDSFGEPLATGDRVIWSHAPCGACEGCASARDSALCSRPQMYGYLNCEQVPYGAGGFAEHSVVLPRAGRVRVPDAVSDELASVAACAVRSAANAVETLGRTKPSDTVLVQGSGPIGLFATAMLSLGSYRELVVVGGPADRLALATSYGATATVSVEEHTTPEAREAAVLVATDGRRPTKMLEMSGGRTAFAEGLQLAGKGARYVLMGQVAGWDTPVPPGRITMKNLDVRGAFSGDITHYREALLFLAQQAEHFDFSAIVSNRYGLSQVNEAMENMRTMRDTKAVILPQRDRGSALAVEVAA